MCPLCEYIVAERLKAWAKREHHEIMRRLREEREHRERCIVCGPASLYLQLWTDAVIGVDVYEVSA
jgi:hypothetical protein